MMNLTVLAASVAAWAATRRPVTRTSRRYDGTYRLAPPARQGGQGMVSQGARRVTGKAAGLVERINTGLVDGQPRRSASERDIIRARISSAISAMPSTVGTALTPGDLIRIRNNER